MELSRNVLMVCSSGSCSEVAICVIVAIEASSAAAPSLAAANTSGCLCSMW